MISLWNIWKRLDIHVWRDGRGRLRGSPMSDKSNICRTISLLLNWLYTTYVTWNDSNDYWQEVTLNETGGAVYYQTVMSDSESEYSSEEHTADAESSYSLKQFWWKWSLHTFLFWFHLNDANVWLVAQLCSQRWRRNGSVSGLGNPKKLSLWAGLFWQPQAWQ